MMSRLVAPGLAPDPTFSAAPASNHFGHELVRPLYAPRAPVRILVIDHGAEDGLAKLLEPSFRVTPAPSTGDGATEDLSLFGAVVLGAHGRLEDRTDRCRRFRDDGYAGGILAICGDVAEGEALLEAGADDFATAPLEARELVTRLRASARRAAAQSRLRWGPLELDRVQREVRLRGRAVALTARESEILSCLIEAGGGAVSSAALRERVWQRKERGGSNLVEVHLSRLRDKLGDDASVIETVRRAGYRLRREQ
jgi:DNA-binding response OmpR family regulator